MDALRLDNNIGQLVDAALHHPEWEFIACSAVLVKRGDKTKETVLDELRQCAKDLEIEITEEDLNKAYEKVQDNTTLLYR
jgi:hypothetical protein